MVDPDTRKKWLYSLFPGIDWKEDEVCSNCYFYPPSWSVPKSEDTFAKVCDHCGAPKLGNTIAPWDIPDEILEGLMEERGGP